MNRFINNLVPQLLSFVCSFFLMVEVKAQQPKLMLPIGHTDIVNATNFSRDCKKIVTASFNNTAKIWDVGSDMLLTDLKEHTRYAYSACFSPAGKKIVMSSANFNIGVVEGEVLAKIILPGETPLFAESNSHNNDDPVAYDDLQTGKVVNRQLNEVSSRGLRVKRMR
jgi:WD40 repeat protein